MKWRLGLDLGTNSIGWSVSGLNSDDEPEKLIDMGVRIFSDGRDPKTKEPLAVARRTARGIRKNLRRRKQRRKALFLQLQSDKLFPSSSKAAAELKKTDPYELRVQALDKELKPYELGRALFNLGVRRGFKSNRKDAGEEAVPAAEAENNRTAETAADISKMSQGEKCISLMEALEKSPYRTLGEFLYNQNKDGNGLRFAPGRFPYYPLRRMYEDEFDAIRKKQKKYYPDVVWDKIKNIIFYQRPLETQERGKCQFMPEHERTFKAMPSANRFRILQDVYNLVMYDELNNPAALTDSQRDTLTALLDSKKEVTFDSMRKELRTENRFNLESDLRKSLKGNETACRLRNERYFGPLWDTLPLSEQDDIAETLIEAEEDSAVETMLDAYNLSDEQKKNIVRYTPSSGTTSMCKLFTQLAVETMEQDRLPYDKALKKMGFNHSEEKVEKYDMLPYYGKVLTGSTIGGDAAQFGEDKPEQFYGKIGNPTVHVALNQTRVVVNALIKQYGKPAQIVVELSRDLKASRDDKAAMQKKQADNAKRNKDLNKSITDFIPSIQYPGRFERLKFRLWKELGAEGLPRKCLYCGQTISAAEIFSPNIEVEHILPYSRTLLDAESNLTVAHKKCNAFKKEHSPYEAFGSSPRGYDWEEICGRVNMLPNKVKRNRFTPDAMDTFEKESGFITRQLTDNAWLSKASRRYLTAVCNNVWTVSGGMTKLLRDKWKIDKILKREIGKNEIAHFGLKDTDIGNYKKNRYDHRHHALDSVVIGLIDRSMVQKIASLNAQFHKNRLEAPPLPFCREELIERVKGIVVSFKPDHGVQGKLSKETQLGCIQQEAVVPIAELTEADIPHIKAERVRDEFEELTAERKSFKKAVAELKDVYPQVNIFRQLFVSRTPVTGIEEKNIEDIIDPVIRSRICAFRDLHPGEKFDKIMTSFSEETGIKKVRCKTRVQTPIVIPPDIHNPAAVTRYLNPEDYFAAIIWEIPPEKEGGRIKYEAQYIRRTEIDKNRRPFEKRPHPAARNICQLHKDDYIEFAENGIWKKARIAGYSATNNGIDIRPVYAVTDCKDWIIATNEHMLEAGWKQQKGQNYVAVNVLFGSRSARKITVSPIGRVFRSK